MKSRCHAWLVLLLLLLFEPARADDTDIYLRQGQSSAGGTRVMLALDFRRVAGVDLCDDAALARCRAVLGNEIFGNLDLYGLVRGIAGDLIIGPREEWLALRMKLRLKR